MLLITFQELFFEKASKYNASSVILIQLVD